MAQRATSLGPKPSFFLLSFPFLSLLLMPKKSFPPKKGHLGFIFECLPLFLLSLFLPPPFLLSLSLSLSCSFPSFFLLVFLFVFFWFLVFLSPSFLFFLHCFCFMKEQHQTILLRSIFPSILSLSLVSCLVVSFKSLFLIFVCFLILSCVFVQRLCFQNKQVEKHQFLVKRGLQQFISLCFAVGHLTWP